MDNTPPSLNTHELESLLVYLKQTHKVDLTVYKRSSLLRRTQLRMQRVGAGSCQEYLDCLQQQADEVTHLLNAVYINYTYFFRDRPVWQCLEAQIIPQIIANKAPDEPIRVWSAGCASGEETYSLAMLLLEALGIKQFQQRVQIYGTDVDQAAILQARQGCYKAHVAETLSANLLERYFEPISGGYRWRQDLASAISFHPHNLIQSPSLHRIDLLVCRNTLMYFSFEAQLRILRRFYRSLKQTGFLLLGRAENLVTQSQTSLFSPLYLQTKVFTRVGSLQPLPPPDVSL
jgi:chemotaxis methyl-accepting protein methylase